MDIERLLNISTDYFHVWFIGFFGWFSGCKFCGGPQEIIILWHDDFHHLWINSKICICDARGQWMLTNIKSCQEFLVVCLPFLFFVQTFRHWTIDSFDFGHRLPCLLSHISQSVNQCGFAKCKDQRWRAVVSLHSDSLCWKYLNKGLQSSVMSHNCFHSFIQTSQVVSGNCSGTISAKYPLKFNKYK